MATSITELENFLHIRNVTGGIDLCFIHIPDFAETYMPPIDRTSFRRERARTIDETGPLSRFFTGEDFRKVNGFKVLKKQAEWMAGKAALKILARMRGLTTDDRAGIAAEESGAPYLKCFPDIPVSISHSGDYAAAAMGGPGGIVALDIERVEEGRMQNIVRVAFTDRESSFLSGKSDGEHYLAWTAKEAYLKYIKKGFAEGLKKVEILNGRVFHHNREITGIGIVSEFFQKDYALTLIWKA